MSRVPVLIAMAALLACSAAHADGAEYEGPLPPPAPQPAAKPPLHAASAPVVLPRPRVRGSLYADSNFQSLTSDRRVFHVGDVITILVAENASASSTADTGTARDSNVGVGLTTTSRARNAGVVANNDYTGSGRTQRAGRVLAQISVTVKDVLPGGDLLVGGEQQLEINGEKQVIRAEGRVRPRDVSEQNVVASGRIADAKLAFLGDGVLGDQQKPRWWQKVLGLFGL